MTLKAYIDLANKIIGEHLHAKRQSDALSLTNTTPNRPYVTSWLSTYNHFLGFLPKQRSLNSDEKSLLKVLIREVALHKRKVDPFDPQTGCPAAQGQSIVQFVAIIKYSIDNCGSLDFLPPQPYVGEAKCYE